MTSLSGDQTSAVPDLATFRAAVLERGRDLYRDLPWRRTRDPYAVLVSEVMLQQTQVPRVEKSWERWMERFPAPEALAEATTADVLRQWQGLGYNRRALNLQNAARVIAEVGSVPSEIDELKALPGVGPATAAGVRAFAFNLPGTYLETNVRSVFLEAFFPDAHGVSDRDLAPLVAASCPCDAKDPNDDPRSWYFALLDVGAWLKKTGPNPNRRSAAQRPQGRFQGSRRQKRAALVRLLLEAHDARASALSAVELQASLALLERKAGRVAPSLELVEDLLVELEREGFCRETDGCWSI